MAMTDDHKAALAEGRLRRLARDHDDAAIRAAEFAEWSREHAKVWRLWRENCGRTQHDCNYCVEFRKVTSAIPYNERCKDDDFDKAREMGLL